MTEIPQFPSAIDHLREQLFLAPQDIGAMCDLAGLLEGAGDLPGAIDLYQRALRVDPYRLDVLLNLGRLWNRLGDADRARSWYGRALSIEPDCVEANAGLATLAEAGALTPTYIRTLFDQYAERFDADLTGTLKYRAPALVGALLERFDIADAAADILDLGCGTGLSGQALKPFARRLDGVDLSPMMVAKARARGIYDDLAVDEAEAYLARSTRDWDIIAAVDMLNYLGDLTPVFRKASARLRPGGLLVGTVEKREEGGVSLSAKRRHTHGADYVRQAVEAAGMALLEISEGPLRQEGGVPVAGLIFAARR